MIRINQIKLKIDHTNFELEKRIRSILGVNEEQIEKIDILRQSIDARKKPELFYIYSVDVTVKNENTILKRALQNKKLKEQVSLSDSVIYKFPPVSEKNKENKTVIVGAGPAGLFCAYYLAKNGCKVILLERGKTVEQRKEDVDKFWKTGVLDTSSNVQFGEGGAGTFSDGKLNTLVKDKEGRNKEVLHTFIDFGADAKILYDAKPHIGTDVLCNIVKRIREEIIALGGEVRFQTQVTDLIVEELENFKRIKGVVINENEKIECDNVVLAIGHSARDTFEMLYKRNIPMEPKAFAVGLRVEHLQSNINYSQYGMKSSKLLGAAPYKVTAKATNGRSVYSFCMCPGGYVVNASSEQGRLAVNGMSYSKRDGKNANSAIIVSVTPEDYEGEGPLSGVRFQRKLEEKAFLLARGKVPVQRLKDFEKKLGVSNERKVGNEEASLEAELNPCICGMWEWADVNEILPRDCSIALAEGMHICAKQIKGFDHPDVILSGVESRTSSPIRIHRDESLQCIIKGLYPCGEGAGYAGGITSAAMDGMRVAEKIASAEE